MLLPGPRGPLTDALVAALRADEPERLPSADLIAGDGDPIADDDIQLALWVAYELHYRGFDEVIPEWEWQPRLIGFRTDLEARVLDALRQQVLVPPSSEPVAARLRALVDDDDGPPLSRYMQTEATLEEFAEFLVHRSIYQLKEADPHSWAIPRLPADAKAALVEVQADEYGAGEPDRMHSELYRALLHDMGLDESYGAYVDAVPGITLAVSNVMSMFGLRRELRGALVGHLAAYEMTSSGPCRRYAKGLRRLRGEKADCEFFDVHVTADALHEQLAAHDLCGGLAEAEPELSEDIVFGAATCLYVEGLFGAHLLGCWTERRSSLRDDVRVGLPSAS
jgi:hypothetical protein